MHESTAAKVAIACTVVLSVILIACVAFEHWPIVGMYVPISDFATILAPLILTAAFIERAVEVLISPFRDPGAALLRNELAVAQAITPVDSDRIKLSQEKLNAYVGQTLKYAFCLLILLGLCAAVVGVRALELFLVQPRPLPPAPQPNFPHVSDAQMTAFRTMDVIISALLLAGGANGLHAPINALTSFMNNFADQNKKIDATPPTGP